MYNFKKEIILIIIIISASCSGMEQSEQERLKRLNAKGEFIHRESGRYQYEIEPPRQNVRSPYSFEAVDKSEK
ncbi:MAG: hypothetical protein RLZZ453_679 [Chlamydiota bacterium]|jgi:hypothetical protein